MLRPLYNWTMRFAEGRHAIPAMGAISFAESSFFPIPPDVVLVPIVLANRDKAFQIAAWCTITSVLGGILGYAIGAFLYESLGQWLLGLYGYGDRFEEARAWYQQYGDWVILVKGLTPIPYKLVTITSGVFGYDFFWFVLLSLITRGARFFLIAGLLKAYGEPIRAFIEKRLELVMVLFLVILVAGFVAVKYLA
ncbi:cytochrome b561 [Terrihabitans soli]|uniref:Cytochrome b561 n=1 Tax=Terrihabitans soli TaxID=708113 RepID=A0A6S6QSE5_9HYPH|nr:YqaA family protein [Terrihabitans soli]BCJ89378.1 cytochrome b561 [Terrihabitans soli]